MQRGVEFLNSSEPSTFPKKDRAPANLEAFTEGFITAEGKLLDSAAEISLPVDRSPLQELVDSLDVPLSLDVVIRLERSRPLLETDPIPGLSQPLPDTRGRFVIDSQAVFQGVTRRVVSLFEHRRIHLQIPVLGRFALVAGTVEGELNQIPGVLQEPLIPPRFSPTPNFRPLVIHGGSPVTASTRAAVLADPSAFLDRAGWVFLGTPQGLDPWNLTLGMGAGMGPCGEQVFLHREREFIFDISQGDPAFGRPFDPPNGWDPLQMWKTHQRYACLTGLYQETKTAGRRRFLEHETRETQRSSLLRLMGTSEKPSPTLVFGKVFRSYILERGLRRIPDPPASPLDPASATPCPFIPRDNFGNPWPGMSPAASRSLQGVCGDSWDDYAQGMSVLMVAPVNEHLAFFFDTVPEHAATRSLQPSCRPIAIPKLGQTLEYAAAMPEKLVLDGDTTLNREGVQVYRGQIQQVLPNLGVLLKARCGRSFPSALALKTYLEQLKRKGRSPTGFYHVQGAFAWSSEFNDLAVGGVGIVCDNDLTVRGSVNPVPWPTLVDAREQTVVLATLQGNLVIETGERIAAALLAPAGDMQLRGGGTLNLAGTLAVARLRTSTLATLAEKQIAYDPSHDWADPTAFRKAFRVMLEQQPMLLVAKPR